MQRRSRPTARGGAGDGEPRPLRSASRRGGASGGGEAGGEGVSGASTEAAPPPAPRSPPRAPPESSAPPCREDTAAVAPQAATQEAQGSQLPPKAAHGDDEQCPSDVAPLGTSSDGDAAEADVARPRGRRGGPRAGGAVRCQVLSCEAILEPNVAQKKYNYRYRLCDGCLRANACMVEGIPQRFCQKCSRFHPLSSFDGPKRTCARMLDVQNCRRRERTLMSAVGAPVATERWQPAPAPLGGRAGSGLGAARAAAAAQRSAEGGSKASGHNSRRDTGDDAAAALLAALAGGSPAPDAAQQHAPPPSVSLAQLRTLLSTLAAAQPPPPPQAQHPLAAFASSPDAFATALATAFIQQAQAQAAAQAAAQAQAALQRAAQGGMAGLLQHLLTQQAAALPVDALRLLLGGAAPPATQEAAATEAPQQPQQQQRPFSYQPFPFQQQQQGGFDASDVMRALAAAAGLAPQQPQAA